MSYTILDTCKGCTACVKICPVNAIRGERNQVHTIDADICIECGACARTCPYQSILDPAGKLHPPIKRTLWLKPSVNAKKCVSCGLCIQGCPTGAMGFAELTDHRVDAIACLENPTICIGCSFCETICPVGAITMKAPLPGS